MLRSECDKCFDDEACGGGEYSDAACVSSEVDIHPDASQSLQWFLEETSSQGKK